MTESHPHDRGLDSPALRLCGWTAVVLAVGFLLASVPDTVAQQPTNTGPVQGRQVSLETQLIVGLKAFTPADRAFIDRAVTAVQQGRLPRKLVDTTFLWARDRAARRSYARQFRPMVYFQPALTLQARAIGVAL